MTDQQKTQRPRYFRINDFAFVVFLLVTIGTVWGLGYYDHSETQKVEGVRTTATKLQSWLEAGQQLRDGDQALDPVACSRGPRQAKTAGDAGEAGASKATGYTWHDCLQALRAPGQAMAGIANPLDPSSLAFAGKCDRSSLPTMGAIIVEKGLAGISGTTQVIAYAPITDDDSLHDEVLLRLSVCGRGFMTLSVAEVKF
jgi:hypothetical protein